MIVIFSIHGDVSTDEVCKILLSEKQDFVRINDDLVTNKGDYKYSIESSLLTLITPSRPEGVFINLRGRNSIWNRKFGFYSKSELQANSKKQLNNQLSSYLNSEYYALLKYFKSSLRHSNNFWLLPDKQVDKMTQLRVAREVGLIVPRTIITNEKDSVISFMKECPKSIVKPLKAGKIFFRSNLTLPLLTARLDLNKVQGMGETFFPSIIQEEIEKEIEIRVFIAEAKFYSMAIFSQNSGRTDVDFRNYDHNKPNRNVPYTLPLKVKSAIKRLMKGLGINTGSVDLIKNKAGEYYFLEVNPSGQYGMVSQPCNFNINRDIAEILIKHNGIT